jgi:hypothetical protein
MAVTKDELREVVHQLAEQAFHQGLISGHGDGEFDQEYQLVLEGKPRHFSLEYARSFLEELLAEQS